MRKIDLWKVLHNVIKRLWLPVLLAVVGAAAALGAVQILPTQWELNAIYLVDIQQPDGHSPDFDTYQFEIQLASTISQVVTKNLKEEEIDVFTLASSNRRIYVSGKNQNKEYLQLLANQIEVTAKECLQTEIGTSATLKTEQYTISEQGGSDSNQMKTVMLGGLIGLCSGFAILLLIEYAKSPILQPDLNQRGRQP